MGIHCRLNSFGFNCCLRLICRSRLVLAGLGPPVGLVACRGCVGLPSRCAFGFRVLSSGAELNLRCSVKPSRASSCLRSAARQGFVGWFFFIFTYLYLFVVVLSCYRVFCFSIKRRRICVGRRFQWVTFDSLWCDIFLSEMRNSYLLKTW